MAILFFDTETSGLRPGSICQLSYIITDGHNIDSNNLYFKVDYVEPGAERVHKLSVKTLAKLSNNRTFKDRIDELKDDFMNSRLLIAHNFNFDSNFMRAEFAKSGERFIYKDSLCTMRHFTDICKIRKYNGHGYKWPRLEELTHYLDISDREIINATKEIFNSDGIGYHDARFDTVATYLSYMKALDKGLISPAYG